MLSPFFLLESTGVSATCGHQELPGARESIVELHDPRSLLWDDLKIDVGKTVVPCLPPINNYLGKL